MSGIDPARPAEAVQVVTTVASQADARRLASIALSEQLAGCVQIDGPIESHYLWQGRLHQDEEWRCVIKTTAAAYARLEQRLIEEHPYDEPEILATPVAAGSRGYLTWLADQVRDTPSSD